MKFLKIFLISVIIFISLYFIWTKLSLSVSRRSDIKFGNELVSNLKAYKLANGHYPAEGDWSTLKSLKFKITEGTEPEYKTLNDSIFELYFIEGFDGPYLTYNSISEEWTMK